MITMRNNDEINKEILWFYQDEKSADLSLSIVIANEWNFQFNDNRRYMHKHMGFSLVPVSYTYKNTFKLIAKSRCIEDKDWERHFVKGRMQCEGFTPGFFFFFSFNPNAAHSIWVAQKLIRPISLLIHLLSPIAPLCLFINPSDPCNQREVNNFY